MDEQHKSVNVAGDLTINPKEILYPKKTTNLPPTKPTFKGAKLTIDDVEPATNTSKVLVE